MPKRGRSGKAQRETGTCRIAFRHAASVCQVIDKHDGLQTFSVHANQAKSGLSFLLYCSYPRNGLTSRLFELVFPPETSSGTQINRFRSAIEIAGKRGLRSAQPASKSKWIIQYSNHRHEELAVCGIKCFCIKAVDSVHGFFDALLRAIEQRHRRCRVGRI